jgi:hypothetical protein
VVAEQSQDRPALGLERCLRRARGKALGGRFVRRLLRLGLDRPQPGARDDVRDHEPERHTGLAGERRAHHRMAVQVDVVLHGLGDLGARRRDCNRRFLGGLFFTRLPSPARLLAGQPAFVNFHPVRDGDEYLAALLLLLRRLHMLPFLEVLARFENLDGDPARIEQRVAFRRDGGVL